MFLVSQVGRADPCERGNILGGCSNESWETTLSRQPRYQAKKSRQHDSPRKESTNQLTLSHGVLVKGELVMEVMMMSENNQADPSPCDSDSRY